MALVIQGNWIISVIVKNPQSLPQKFIISNATVGNGTYIGFSGNTVAVNGNAWLLNIQANEEYDETGQWINSTLRKTNIRQENGFNVFEVESEDLIQDNSFDDLVLQLKQPIPVVQPPVVIIPPVVVTPTTPVIPPPIIQPPTTPVDLGSGKIYTRLNSDEILPLQKIQYTYGIWSDANSNLTSFHTGSTSYQIYQLPYNSCGSLRMFDIAYGHKDGSGSLDLGSGKDYFTLSNAIYSQYKNLCGDDFILPSNQPIKHFYAINVRRDRMGDNLDNNMNEINIHHLSGSQWGINQTHTGSNVRLGTNGAILRLIDFEKYLVSGSLEDGIYNSSNPHYYGLFYPKLGVYIIDADKLDVNASFLTVTGSDINGQNEMKLFTAISGAAKYTDVSGDYMGLKSRKKAWEFRNKFIIRVKNFDYNFSNNSTFWSGSEGYLIPAMANNNPQTYPTTIGLYNDNYELLAVGKINYPQVKNYTTEALYEVQIRFK